MSFMFIILESVPTIDVPENPTPSITTDPDPLGTNLRSSFAPVDFMLLSSMVIPGNTTFPVPDGLITMSALDAVVLMLFWITSMSDATEGRR